MLSKMSVLNMAQLKQQECRVWSHVKKPCFSQFKS